MMNLSDSVTFGLVTFFTTSAYLSLSTNRSTSTAMFKYVRFAVDIWPNCTNGERAISTL